MDIYFDNSATTKPHNSVIDAMVNMMKDAYGNPSSLHTKGVEAERMVKKAREHVAKALKVNADEVYFTSCGTESNNIAILGIAMAQRIKGEVITTKVEHKSVTEPFKYLEKMGFKVHYLDVDSSGIIDLSKLEELLNDNTQLVSIIQVNNECGMVQPIKEISRIIKRKNEKTLLHIDAVQGFCKVELPKNCADLISISAHKIHGPKGVAALYVRKGVKISPIIYGGGQEKSLRSGTENTPAIVGFGVAAELAKKEDNYNYVLNLKNTMLEKIIDSIPNVYINSPQESSPYILNISVMGIRSEILLHSLEQRGVYVSSGSACSSNRPKPSHVLIAMGFSMERVDSSIRISFCPNNTMQEVLSACEILIEVVQNINKLGALKNNG